MLVSPTDRSIERSREARTLALVCACVCAGSGARAAQAAPTSEIVIGVGGSRELSAPAGSAIYVGDGRMIKASDLGNRVRLTGRRVGTAELRIGKAAYLARVLPLESAKAFERIETALAGRKGLAVEALGNQIVIKGRLLRAEDWEALARAAGDEISYRFSAEIDPAAESDARALILRRLAGFNLPEPSLKLAPNAVASIGTERADLEPKYVQALKSYGFMIDKNSSVIALAPLIRVNILIAEIKRSFEMNLGVKWPESAHAQLLPLVTAPGSDASPIGIDVNALERTGMGRVLASPNLLCRSGKEAQFFAGGEFPVKVATYRNREVIWKKYGVMLKIKPTADAQGQMSIGLETEISDLDTTFSVDGAPAIFANRIESHFDLRKSRTIALSGLIKKQSKENSSGLPGLARIPILGSLFGSRDWLDRKSELVVFVTPEVLPQDTESP